MLKTKKLLREKLSLIYAPSETESLISLILEHVTGYNRLQLHLNQAEQLPEPKIMQIMQFVNRLLNHEPIQYIIGETEFCGLKFTVSPGALIPRAETEELVDWIIRDEGETAWSLLDIGTGSGCIPIAIEKNTRLEIVEGWDISEEALELARQNAARNDSKVKFSIQNIFHPSGIPETARWDVIVSNPPYVLLEESALMEKNVVDYEPHVALFVPDNDPLIFYRAISQFAIVHLQLHGNLYFEINESQGGQVASLLSELGFTDIQLRKDLQGKERMIRAKKFN